MEGKRKRSGTNIIFGVVLIALAVFYLADSFGEAGSTQTLLIVGVVAAIVLAVVGYQAMQKKQRLNTLGNLRPGAVVIDGFTPLYMTLPPPTTEKEQRKAKSTPKPATLAITSDAVELWAGENNPEVVRSIPTAEVAAVTTEVVNFGRLKSGMLSPDIEHEAIIVTSRDGADIIMRPNKLGEALQQVKEALNRTDTSGNAS